MPKTLAFFLLSLFIIFGCARKNYYQQSALVSPEALTAIPSGTKPDSVLVTAGKHYQKGWMQNLLFGKHYRKVWAEPVKLPVLDISKVHSGLTPVSMGGGFQTTSLTMKDKDGKLYVLRSLDKNPEKTLPPGIRETFILNVVRDQTSATNPYGSVVLPRLSEAAGIFYTSPQIFFVAPSDSSMGKHAERVNGKVMMLEEKFDGKQNLTPAFGNAIDLIDTEDVLELRFANNKHLIDQNYFARNRLFDVLIGDWDRHEGQWQWAVYKKGDNFIYKAIPKDRDQAFHRFNDGLITRIASMPLLMKKFQTFDHSYGHIPGWLFNARFIDDRALTEVTRQEWVKHAEEMQAALTDEVIAEAIAEFPSPIYRLTGPETISKLKSRRDKLPKAANQIYEHLAKEVTVAGTDQKERFVVERLPNGDTKVEVFRDSKKDPGPFYSHTFHRKETKQITLHGLRGNDDFEISGTARKAIKLNVYGGPGEDELVDTSKISGWGKTIFVYDTKRGIEIEAGKETRKRLSRSVAVHAYDREGL